MKKTFITIILSLCCAVGWSQSFEGEVIYHMTYKSKIPNVSDEQITAMAGNTINYYIKGGNYRAESNGKLLLWQLYVNTDNKLYNKIGNTDTLYWNDGAVNQDSILSTQLNKDVTEILGYKCDELILNCKSGVQKYYFSSKIPIDSKLYSKQVYENWYDYLKITHAMPLKIILDNAEGNSTMLATDIKAMKLDDSMFVLPPDSKLKKSPY